MVIRRVDPVSVGKIAGLLYALMGLIVGALFSLVAMAGASFGSGMGDGAPLAGMLFGVGAIIVLPIFYGVLGFVCTLIAAVLYNVVAGIGGGIRIDVEQG
ncbi:MAG TPA: hypothetical protein VMM93_11140 [Vicinamibacterales bacterium]|nr:hypothetical protein [Vicinamibacterales bacterium]